MQSLFQVVPNARRLEVPHVCPQRFMAIQMSHMFQRILQAHQSQEPFVLAYW